jgi:hypothetical protein
MNTDEAPAHFAWDLLDSAKQVVEPRSAETQAVEKPAAAEPQPQPQVPDIRPESQPVIRPAECALDDAPIGQQEPPETLIVRLEQATAEGRSPAPLQSKSTADSLPVSTDPPEPEAEGSPTGGQSAAAAIILTKAAAAIEEPSNAPLQPEPAVEEEPASVRMLGESGRLPVLGQQPLPVRSDGDIPKLSWNDVGMATEPGQYKSRYGLVQVRADEIWIWKMHPNATFVVMQPSPYSGQDVSRLGSFDLGNQEHFAQDEK